MKFGQHQIVLGGEDLVPAALPDTDVPANSATHPQPRLAPDPKPRTPVGQLLVSMGALSQRDLSRAMAMRQREDARIGDILLAHGMVEESDLYTAIATQYGACVADFETYPADVRLIEALGAERCLRDGILPWRRAGGSVLIATCRPEEFEKHRPELTRLFGNVRIAVASETSVHASLLRARQRKLAASAETRVAASESCREMDITRLTKTLSVIGIASLVLAAAAPHAAFIALTAWAVLTLVVNSGLKIAAAFAQAGRRREVGNAFASARPVIELPTVSVMVPLFREREITARLVKRLSRIDYPRELLDICLVVEEDDQVTQVAVHNADLPRWMRMIIVPRGGVKTKPRALNFALDFCRGSIIGIWDAEDAPEKAQIHKVVRHFAQADPDVACLQGVLDFYNARTNWLARCFAVEYASWFRVILPGYERMGLVVPLGGTTLFFRRDAIEELGGWDAHNVTEDADLGIRLARHGYRTELIATVTEEEANCRPWPWIKQRSRWLKGYAMTWAVHMRSPRKLLADLGPWRFFGVQALFLGTLSQFVLAPFLWSFWALMFGLPHPLKDVLPREAFLALGALFLLSEVITITVGVFATATPKHKWLWPWVPTLHVYYPLATAAAIKGLWEIVARPYYWDKTVHGVADVGHTLHDDRPAAKPRRKANKPSEKPAARLDASGETTLDRGVFVTEAETSPRETVAGTATTRPAPPSAAAIPPDTHPVLLEPRQAPDNNGNAADAIGEDIRTETREDTQPDTGAPAPEAKSIIGADDDPRLALQRLLETPLPSLDDLPRAPVADEAALGTRMLQPDAPTAPTAPAPKRATPRKPTRVRFNYHKPAAIRAGVLRQISRAMPRLSLPTPPKLSLKRAAPPPPLFISTRSADTGPDTKVTPPAPAVDLSRYDFDATFQTPLQLLGFAEDAAPETAFVARRDRADLYLPFVPRVSPTPVLTRLDLRHPIKLAGTDDGEGSGEG